MLLCVLSSMCWAFTNLSKKHDEIKIQLQQSATLIKFHSINNSLNCLQSTKTSIIERRLQDGIQQNPNKIIKNSTNIDLSNDEIPVLELALKHCVLIRPKKQK